MRRKLVMKNNLNTGDKQLKQFHFNKKKTFYSKKISDNKKNIKTLWKNIKKLSGKETNHQTNFINDDQGNPILDSCMTAETFNTFFANIFKMVHNPPQNLDQTNLETIKLFVDSKISNEKVVEMHLVTENFIVKELKALDETKSTGLDDIGPKILKVSHAIIAKPLTKKIILASLNVSSPLSSKEQKSPLYLRKALSRIKITADQYLIFQCYPKSLKNMYQLLCKTS
ncbi:hypothetical protein ACF0H5_020862 [Mactra antiquata]